MEVAEVYAAVLRFVFIRGKSQREAARVFGPNRETVAKMCRFSLPPGYAASLRLRERARSRENDWTAPATRALVLLLNCSR